VKSRLIRADAPGVVVFAAVVFVAAVASVPVVAVSRPAIETVPARPVAATPSRPLTDPATVEAADAVLTIPSVTPATRTRPR
jgi:hypothetical protein